MVKAQVLDLKDLLINETAVVVELAGGARAYRQRLVAAGIRPGVEIKIIQKAPVGDLVKILVDGSYIALRLAEAAIIKIKK